jgi:hypothetical protein
MKKIILLASVLGASIFASAQVTFGPKIGLGMSAERWKIVNSEGGAELPTTLPGPKFSPSLGFAMNAALGDYFAIQPAIQYTAHGTKFSILGTTVKTTVHYIQIPVQAIVNYPINDDMKIGLGVGPYLGFTFGGSYKVEGGGVSETGTIKAKGDVKEADGKEKTKFVSPLDYGLSVGPVFQVKSFQIALNYNLGFANTTPTFEGKKSAIGTYNVWYGLNVAYFLGGK